MPDGFLVKGGSTYYNKDGKAAGQWGKSLVDQDRQIQLLREFVAGLAEEVRGLGPVIKPPKVADAELLCVYPLGAPQFGIHVWWQDASEDFDLKKAEALTCGAVDRLVASAPPAHTAVLLNLGDMFHADNQKNQSQSGH